MTSASVDTPPPAEQSRETIEATPGRRLWRSGRGRQPTSYVGMLVLGLAALYFLAPLYWLFIASTKNVGDLYNSFGFWFSGHWNLWDNLSQLWVYQGGVYRYWFFNSFLYAMVCASVTTVVSAMAGYALAKYEFWGRDTFFAIILGAILVPTTALVLPLYLLMSKWNLANTYLAVMLPFFISPLGVYLSRIYAAASVPNDLLDAARVDGAGEFRTFLTIVRPIITPALVTVFLFQFIAVWNSYFLPLVMLSDTKTFPLSLGLATWAIGQASYARDVDNLLVTGSLVSVLPLIILFFTLQRYWRNGIAAGSLVS